MTDTTPNLALPELIASQAQKHVTVNEALRALDALVQLAVLDRDLATPPGSPHEGERWLIAASPTGGWVGHAGHVAAWQDGDWEFYPPQIGWLAYVIDEGVLLAWTGTAWVNAISAITSLNNMTVLGVGTAADATNPFSAKLNNVLWVAKAISEGGDGDLRWKMSKESAGDTLSMLFQTAYSGRAEIGLTGDDDMHIKVSADGTSWLDALTVERATGKVSFGQGFQSAPTTRSQLAAAPFDALAFNGLQLNGGIDVSQENGTTELTLASGTIKVVADLWSAQYVHGAATAIVKSRQIAAASFPVALPGYSFGHQIKATTALSSPANGDYAKHIHLIEGYRIARLAWGTASAQPLAFGFRFYSTVPGTAFLKFSNGARNRCYYKEITVSAGWNWLCGTIAGDTSGTWDATNGTGLIVEIFSAGKAASPATPGAWGSTSTTQTTNSTNLLGTNNNLTIVTGLVILPGVEMPSSDRAALIMRPYPTELAECRRYFLRIGNPSTATMIGPAWLDAGGDEMMFMHFMNVEMRDAPVIAVNSSVRMSVTGTDPTVAAADWTLAAVAPQSFRMTSNSVVTGTEGWGGGAYVNAGNYLDVNARLSP